MKKTIDWIKNSDALMIAALAVLLAVGCLLAGCQTAHVKVGSDGTWEATVRSHMFSREFSEMSGEVQDGGKFKFALKGYKGDTSEQLPNFTREMWSGLGFIGQLAASMYSPAAATVKNGTASTASTANCQDGSCGEK